MAQKTLGEVADYINGRAFKPDEWEDDGLPIIRIQNLTGSTDICNRTTKTYEEKYLVVDGDLLFAWSASLGAHIWHGENGWLNQHIFKVMPHKETDKYYLYYYLLHVVDQLYAKTHGSGMVHITLKPFKNTAIYIPSLSEQRRIVDRIEGLFTRLDEAKEKAQVVVDGFELRKSAILHKAFTGELTERWRKEHGVGLDSWKQAILMDVLKEKPRNGYSPKPVNYVTAYKSMTLSAITSGVFREEYFKYIDETIQEDSYLWLQPEDILIQRANSLDKVGTSAIYTSQEHEFIYPDLMMKLQVVETASPRFVAYYLKRNDIMAYFRENATGTAGNMPKINQKTVSNTPLTLPTLDEQIEIVRILENLFVKEQQAKESAEVVLTQIDTMKKAILARAFRGELGTNDPEEKWAGELVKAML